jgi:hypothetical protein
VFVGSYVLPKVAVRILFFYPQLRVTLGGGIPEFILGIYLFMIGLISGAARILQVVRGSNGIRHFPDCVTYAMVHIVGGKAVFQV